MLCTVCIIYIHQYTLVPVCPDSLSQCTKSWRGFGLSISTGCPLRLNRSFLDLMAAGALEPTGHPAASSIIAWALRIK